MITRPRFRALPPHPRKRVGARAPTIELGRVLGGQYRLGDVIGQGGMGTVYRAEQVALARTVAVKVFDPSSIDSQALRRFQDEVRLVGRLHHPNTVALIDAGRTDDGWPFLVMEYVAGSSLRALIAGEVLSLRRAAQIVGQILAALDDVHRASVVHRDVKSDNVMVEVVRGRPDVVKLIDFGLACAIGGAPLDDHLSGTPEFMAPELIQGASPAAASDLYAAGVILYEVLTGGPPFVGRTPTETLAMQLSDVVIPPSLRCPERSFSPELERVVVRALGKTPRERYASAEEFAHALARAAPTVDDDVVRPRTISSDGVPGHVAEVATQSLAAKPSEEERDDSDEQIRAAIQRGDVEEAAARLLGRANALADANRLAPAIDLLERGVLALRACAVSSTRLALCVWPVLATLARRLDDAGDRGRARRTAAQAEREAVRGGSTFGRDSTRLLLLHLALRRRSSRRAFGVG